MKPFRYLRAAFLVAMYFETREDGDTDFSALTYNFDDVQPGRSMMHVVFQDLVQNGFVRAELGSDPANRPTTYYKPTPRLMVLIERYMARDSWTMPPPRIQNEKRVGPTLSELGDCIDLALFDDIFGLEH